MFDLLENNKKKYKLFETAKTEMGMKFIDKISLKVS